MANGSLMKVESIEECSKGIILQYFWHALNDKRSWKPIFGLFESDRFTNVLLYSLSKTQNNMPQKKSNFGAQQENDVFEKHWREQII